jgi:hypothetical protein
MDAAITDMALMAMMPLIARFVWSLTDKRSAEYLLKTCQREVAWVGQGDITDWRYRGCYRQDNPSSFSGEGTAEIWVRSPRSTETARTNIALDQSGVPSRPSVSIHHYEHVGRF